MPINTDAGKSPEVVGLSQVTGGGGHIEYPRLPPPHWGLQHLRLLTHTWNCSSSSISTEPWTHWVCRAGAGVGWGGVRYTNLKWDVRGKKRRLDILFPPMSQSPSHLEFLTLPGNRPPNLPCYHLSLSPSPPSPPFCPLPSSSQMFRCLLILWLPELALGPMAVTFLLLS